MLKIADRDCTRAGFVAGLRKLADLLEEAPDIPHTQSISFALDGTEAEVAEVMDRAAAALTAVGIAFEYEDFEGCRRFEFVVAGVRYGFSWLSDADKAAYDARRSYEDNVQVA